MDPVRNPYAPGAGQRPPELAGRDSELSAFDVVLERVARGRPERELVLTGLRGVGKTVLLNHLRRPPSAAAGAPARSRPGPTSRCAGRWPRRCTWRCASSARGTATRSGRRVPRRAQGVRAAGTSADGEGARPLAAGHRRARGDRPRRLRRPGDRPGRAVRRRRRGGHRPRRRHRAVHRRDAGRAARRRLGALRRLPRAVPAGRAADRGRRRAAAPARGAVGLEELLRAAVPLPAHRPARPRGGRPGADRPGRAGGRRVHPEALDALYDAADGYPYFVQAYGKVTWDVAAA